MMQKKTGAANSDYHDWDDLPAFFSPPVLAQFLGIGRAKAYDMTRIEGFPAMRVGKRIIINRDGLQRWTARQMEPEGAQSRAKLVK